jgi:ribosomal protein S18 acetylase RimI-like enzyme
MSPEDIDAVVTLQEAHLNGSIVTQLGSRFLSRFHAVALSHPATVALVARDGQSIVGFALGTTDVQAFNRHAKPRILGALIRALASPTRVRLSLSLAQMAVENEPQPPVSSELLLLAVDRRARRRGVGAELIAALERVLVQRHVARYRVAMRSHLAEARAFYAALGFQHEQERRVLGHPMTYLTKQVSPDTG